MKIFLFLFALFIAIFFVHYTVTGQAVYGDGIDYWAYLPTWYFDHDLDFSNQFKHIYNNEYNNAHPEAVANDIQKTHINPNGTVDDIHTQGVATMLLPFFVLADLALLFINTFGGSLLRNGYSDVYQVFTGLGAIFYMMLGTVITVKLCTKWTNDERAGKWAMLAVLLCSPLFYYAGYDVINSHPLSFFLTSAFWYLLLFVKPTVKQAVGIGFVLGFAAMNRLQDVLLVLPFFALLWKSTLSGKFRYICVVLLTCLLVNIPMILTWLFLYEVPFPASYFVARKFKGIFGIFFHQTNGIFSRTPLMLFAIAGVPIALTIKKKSFQTLVISGYLLLNIVLIAMQGGWRDAAYGGRMFISLMPLFALFIAEVFNRMDILGYQKLPAILVSLCFLLNVASAAHFVLYEKQAQNETGKGLEQKTQQRIETIFQNIP